MDEHLRPIERRITSMYQEGLATDEIARRIKRSADHVERMLEWTSIPRSRPPMRRNPRAIERRVLHFRRQGESHEDIAVRFNRSPRSIRQIEGLAHYRMALDLLGSDQG